MRKKPFIYFFLALVLAFGACSEPIFYMISVEPPITKPLIDGHPTNFVEYKGKLYVASGSRIFNYDGNEWKSSQPGGRIVQLAATDNFLYALSLQGSGNSRSIKYSNGGDWNDMNVINAQSIFAADNVLFIGSGYGDVDNNEIYYVSDTGSSVGNAAKISGTDGKSLLNGMAYNGTDYFLCTNKSGIFHVSGGSLGTAATITESSSINFTGIIGLGNNNILAISRDGELYNVNTVSVTKIPDISIGNNRFSTGALAVWEDPKDSTKKLLLAGRQESLIYDVVSGYTYGYMELELDSGGTNGIKAGINFTEPGKADVSSVADNERYVSTIGKYPVNHIFQTTVGGNKTLFASTQKNGVWSYRQRGSESIWNAEE